MEHLEYPTEKSIEKLCRDLGLKNPDEYSQNWANEAIIEDCRIEELVRYYQDNELDNETKFTLMILIINLLNDMLGEGKYVSNEICDDVSYILLKESEIHSNTISYWSMEDEKDLEYAFPVTPYMRIVLSKITQKARYSDSGKDRCN